MSEPVRFDFTIQKSDRTGRFVAGWLSVVEKNGQPVEDTQGDVIEIGEVAKAFRAYMKGARVIKARHSGAPVGELVEMVVVDDDFAKAVGMTDTKRGVWGGAEITDEKTREEVKSGVLKSFSIGGRGKRTPIAKSKRFVTLGSGRKVGLGAYTRAWRQAKTLPAGTRVRETPGSGVGGNTAGTALREFREGMHDRINTRGKLKQSGRKWSDEWQSSARRAQHALRAGARMERDTPKSIKRRLPHRVRKVIAKMNPDPSSVHADRVIGSIKKPIGGGRVRFTLSEKRRRLVRRALQR